MSNRRAFTLIEIISTATIIILIMSTVFYVYFSARSTDAGLEAMEQYYQLCSKLEMNLKRDLRGAISFNENQPGRYELEVMTLVPKGGVVNKKIIYIKSADNKIIERIVEGKVEKYDFTKLIKDNEFVFNIYR